MENPVIYIVMESLENGKSCMHHSNYFTLDEAIEFVKNNKAKFGDSYFILDSNGVEIPVPKDLWAECVEMAKQLKLNIMFDGLIELYTFDSKTYLTLPELHAKLTELTKG